MLGQWAVTWSVAGALASAVVLGCADFAGGLAARRVQALVVVVWANSAGLVTALALSGVTTGRAPAGVDLGWGAAAGLAGALGAVLLYYALAIGVMSIVAPVTAVTAAAVPVIVGLLGGDRVSAVVAVGMILALAALPAVSASGGERLGRSRTSSGLGVAMLAGAGFGAFFVFLSHTGEDAGLWPLVAARVASLTLLAVILKGRGGAFRVHRHAAGLALLAGFLDMLSSVLYLLAVRAGSLAITGLLASLYPVSTVALAAFLLKERIRRVQQLGVVVALVAVALIAWG